MAAQRQLRLFVSPAYERRAARARRLGYSSPNSATRFGKSLMWDEIRLEAEKLGLPKEWLGFDGRLRRAAYRWWAEDGGDAKRDKYIRQSPEKRSGIRVWRDRKGEWRHKRVAPAMPGYRHPVASGANETLVLLQKRTQTMRFAVGDTQAHLPSYFRQLHRATVQARKK